MPTNARRRGVKSDHRASLAPRWRPYGRGLTFELPGVAGELALDGATPALRKLTIANETRPARWPGPLLGVEAIQIAGGRSYRVSMGNDRPTHRVRGNIADVQLEASRRCPARLHFYWRASEPRQLDLEVLVATTPETGHLEVVTTTHVPRARLFVPIGSGNKWLDASEAERLGASHLVVPRDRDAATWSLDGRRPRFPDAAMLGPYRAPIVLFRPNDQDWSYVEMSHTDDCARIVTRTVRGAAHASFGLFGLDLEKGVILRGRVRGCIIARESDADRAMELAAAFAAESPYLSV